VDDRQEAGQEYYFIAISDRNAAAETLRLREDLHDNAKVEMLCEVDFDWLDLKEGEVLCLVSVK
jgi:hypothetical protein